MQDRLEREADSDGVGGGSPQVKSEVVGGKRRLAIDDHDSDDELIQTMKQP